MSVGLEHDGLALENVAPLALLVSLVGLLGHELERFTGELALADLARSVDPLEGKLSTPACGLGDGILRHAALVNVSIFAATTEGDEGSKLSTGRLHAEEADWLF